MGTHIVKQLRYLNKWQPKRRNRQVDGAFEWLLPVNIPLFALCILLWREISAFFTILHEGDATGHQREVSIVFPDLRLLLIILLKD